MVGIAWLVYGCDTLKMEVSQRRAMIETMAKSLGAAMSSTLSLCALTPVVLTPQRRNQDWYKRYYAAVEIRDASFARALEPFKATLFDKLPKDARVVEFGAGGGVNARYIASMRPLAYTAVDKNPFFDAELGRTFQAECNLTMLRTLRDVPSASAEVVVATLVLCSVHDPLSELDQIRRILTPNGRYLFVEHVRSTEPRYSIAQRLVKPVQSALADGCNPVRDTEADILNAGFEFDTLSRAFLPGHFPVGPVIAGIARLRS